MELTDPKYRKQLQEEKEVAAAKKEAIAAKKVAAAAKKASAAAAKKTKNHTKAELEQMLQHQQAINAQMSRLLIPQVNNDVARSYVTPVVGMNPPLTHSRVNFQEIPSANGENVAPILLTQTEAARRNLLSNTWPPMNPYGFIYALNGQPWSFLLQD